MNQQTALAKSLLARGYAIFPVVPGFKFPANTNGFLEASSDTLTALPWFSGARRNIGIATGDASGVVVIDLDLYKPECAVNYNELCDRLGYLPKTFTVQTRAGGQHLYFRKPGGFDLRSYNNVLAKGVDVRGNGGYVLSEGSFVREDKYGPTGEYTVIDGRPVEHLPEAWARAWQDLNIPGDEKLAKKAARDLAKVAAAAQTSLI